MISCDFEDLAKTAANSRYSDEHHLVRKFERKVAEWVVTKWESPILFICNNVESNIVKASNLLLIFHVDEIIFLKYAICISSYFIFIFYTKQFTTFAILTEIVQLIFLPLNYKGDLCKTANNFIRVQSLEVEGTIN